MFFVKRVKSCHYSIFIHLTSCSMANVVAVAMAEIQFGPFALGSFHKIKIRLTHPKCTSHHRCTSYRITSTWNYSAASFFLMLAIAFPGFKCFGQTLVQFIIV